MNVVEMVEAALRKANKKTVAVGKKEEGAEHRKRSARFVEALAECLKRESRGSGEIKALHKPVNEQGKKTHPKPESGKVRAEFGMDELLFDVLVCDTGTTNSPRGTKLTYIQKGIWAVESELARNSREALYDFNKLVLADAQYKLFVGSYLPEDEMQANYVHDEDFLKPLADPARHIRGECFAVLIPHPSAWKKGARLEARGWTLGGRQWVPLEKAR